MAEIRKFAFDMEFSPDGAILRDGDPANRKWSNDEVEAERKSGYERGKKDALVAAEKETAAALQALGATAGAMLQRLDAESRAMREDAARIALVAARKIASAALDQFGVENAANAIEEAMDTLRHQPRLLVKLPPAEAEKLRPRIEGLADIHAYAGAILVRDDANMKAGQISIDWSDGVVSHDPAETAARIETLIDAALAAAVTHERN